MNWYFGDLHCHTNLSYGRGTMERAFEIGRTHLDFCTVTGHAFWPDMPEDLQHYDPTISLHMGGFAKCRKYWQKYLEVMESYNSSELVTFPSYEWHSNRYGDYNVLACGATLELVEARDLRDFESAYSSGQHLIVPHHIGYTNEHRGIDWDTYRSSRLTAVIEVYSNHGCSMSEESPFDYYHVMGPRDGTRTMEYGLLQGVKCGFIASTDSHDGFPGHYSHGRVGVLATGKNREAIWQALVARRTVALTGAKIVPAFEINGAPLGSEIKNSGRRDIRFSLEGNQPFRYVEVVKNGKILRRGSSLEFDASKSAGTYFVKVECGWGMKDQIVRWDNYLSIADGSVLGVEACFRPSVIDTSSNAPPHQITEMTDRTVRWQSCTRGVPDSFVHNPETMTSGVNALVIKVEASDKTSLSFRSNVADLDCSWLDLQPGSRVRHAAGPGSPAVRIRRPYPVEMCTVQDEISDLAARDEDFYYLRAAQVDNESIWVTPIWVAR